MTEQRSNGVNRFAVKKDNARLYPGLLLIVVGLGAMGLGLFEISAPTVFDENGGRLLEELYGLNR
jgi:hypothetical protein